MRLGRVASITTDLTALFPRDSELQCLMCEYLTTITTFCKKIVVFAQKSLISQLSSLYTISYEVDFKTFELDLQQWSVLVEKRISVLTSQAQLQTGAIVRASQKLVVMTSEKKKNEFLCKRKDQVLDTLCPDQASFDLTWRRQRKKGSPEWIFSTESYKRWKRSDQSRALWVHGKLGSGKTVLLASIVGNLWSGSCRGTTRNSSNEELPVCFFFCRYSQPQSLTARSILGSIARQLVSTLDNASDILQVLAKKLIDDSFTLLPEDMCEIISSAVNKDTPVTLVIDALDECIAKVEVAQVVSCLRKLLERNIIRLLFSTRTNSSVAKFMAEHFPLEGVTLSELVMAEEMRAFVCHEFERRRHIRVLDATMEKKVKDVLISASAGMYVT